MQTPASHINARRAHGMSGDTDKRTRSWLDYFGWTSKEATGEPVPTSSADVDADPNRKPRRKTYREALLGGATVTHESDAALLHETYFFV